DARRELLEHVQQFPEHRRFGRSEAGDVAARARQAGNEAGLDGIDNPSKNDRDAAGLLLHGLQRQCSADQDCIRIEAHELLRMGADASGVGSAPPLVETDAAAIVPAELLQRLAESLEIGLLLNIFGERVEHADTAHTLALLPARRERPRGRAAEQREELTPPMPNWRTFVDLHRAPLAGIALPDSCHKLRNAGQVFATNRETKSSAGEIRLKQVCGTS